MTMRSNHQLPVVLQRRLCFLDLPMQLLAKLSLSNFGVRKNGRRAQWFLSPLIRSTGVITSTRGLHAGVT